MRLFNGKLKLDAAEIKKVFMLHLNNTYAIKTYLVTNLPKLTVYTTFPDITNAIHESIGEIKIQLLRMDVIYAELKEGHRSGAAMGMKAFSIETVATLKQPGITQLETDVIILLHLNMLEGIEVSSYTALYDLALSMPHNDIAQLIKENLDMAKDSRELYRMITKEFID